MMSIFGCLLSLSCPVKPQRYCQMREGMGLTLIAFYRDILKINFEDPRWFRNPKLIFGSDIWDRTCFCSLCRHQVLEDAREQESVNGTQLRETARGSEGKLGGPSNSSRSACQTSGDYPKPRFASLTKFCTC